MSIVRTGNGDVVDQNNPLPVDLSTAEAIIPTDIQSHLQSTIQTHNAVSIVASGSSNSSWFDTDGFDAYGITTKNDATASFNVNILWSNDGSNIHAQDNAVITGSNANKAYDGKTRARYVQIQLYNGDTLSHTMSSWLYLKA